MRKAMLPLLALVGSLLSGLGSAQITPLPDPIPDPAVQGTAADEPARIESIDVTVRFETDGTGATEFRARTRILSQTGVQQHSQVYVAYQSSLQRVQLLSVKTIKPDGSEVPTDLGNAQIINAPVAPNAPVFTDIKYVVLPVADLQVGDLLDYGYRIEVENPLKPGDFWQHYFLMRHLSVVSETVRLDLPKGRDRSFDADPDYPFETHRAGGRVVRTWKLGAREPEFDREPIPLFEVSSLADWNALGSWLDELAAGRSRPTPPLIELAESLTRTAATRREKIEAIYQHVAQNVRYTSISLGLGGYQPHHAAEVWQNRFGDCKDKHALMTALLGAVGVPVQAAYLNTQWKRAPRVPSPMNFDHVISAVPIEGEWLWLDSTFGTAPTGYIPSHYRGKTVLRTNDGTALLVELPGKSPIADRLDMTLTGSIGPTGTLEGSLTQEMSGHYEIAARHVLRSGDAQALDWYLKTLRPFELWDAEVESRENTDPADLSSPLSVSYSMTQKQYIDPLQRSVRVTLPRFSLRVFPWGDVGETETAEEAKPTRKEGPEESPDPIFLGGPLELRDRVSLNAGEIYLWHGSEAAAQETDFAVYKATLAIEGGKLVADRRLTIKAFEIAANRRGELIAFDKAVREGLERSILLERLAELDLAAYAAEQDAETLIEAGRAAMQKLEVDLAIDLFTRATEKAPDHREVWLLLGRALAGSGELDRAEQAYQRQFEIAPDQPQARMFLALLQKKRNRFEEALATIDAHLRTNATDGVGLGLKGDLLGALKRWPEAEAVYRRALDVASADEPSFFPWVALGRALACQGKSDEALKQFESALRIADTAAVNNEVAMSLADCGEGLVQALEYAESAVARASLELRLMRKMRDWTHLWRSQVALAAYLDTQGWILLRKGELQEAVRFLHAAGALDPDPEILAHVAAAKVGLGQPERAVEVFAQAVLEARGDPLPPEELASLLEERFPDEGAWEGFVEQQRANWAIDLIVVRQPEGIVWPDAKLVENEKVLWAVRVDSGGKVLEAQPIEGAPEWIEASRAAVERLSLEGIAWDGASPPTGRFLAVDFSAGRRVLIRRMTHSELALAGRAAFRDLWRSGSLAAPTR